MEHDSDGGAGKESFAASFRERHPDDWVRIVPRCEKEDKCE